MTTALNDIGHIPLPEFDIFRKNSYQGTIEETYTIPVYPSSSNLNDPQLDFFIPPSPTDYTLLKSSTLFLKVIIKDLDTKKPVAVHEVTAESSNSVKKAAGFKDLDPSKYSVLLKQNFGQTLFSSVNVTLNSQSISTLDDNYHLKSYVNNLINYNEVNLKHYFFYNLI